VVYDERWTRVNFPCTHSETQLHEGTVKEKRGYLILILRNQSKGCVNHSRSRDNAHLERSAIAVAVKQAEVPG
jgi:hypothetical protein